MQTNPAASVEQWERLRESAPQNPFLTAEYALARQSLGETPVMLGHGAELCPAYLRRGRLSADLDVPSLPFAPSAAFLSGLIDFCRTRRIYEVRLNTFASPALTVPQLPREIERRPRTEFLLDLTVPASQWKIGENHRRHIRGAQKSSVAIRRARLEGLQDHFSLCRASLARREERGEVVPSVTESPEATSLVRNGVGELFQAVRDGIVLSSMLVLKSRAGAYYHSAGTSPEGRAIGASHFLVHSVAAALQLEGIQVFNLGGAGAESQGLRTFKARFGTVAVETEAVSAVLCSTAHRVFVETCRVLRRIGSR